MECFQPLRKERWSPLYSRNQAWDPHDAANYRPISNLSYLSKLLERCVNDQIHNYLSKNDFLPVVQSAYRKHHSTETAVLKVLSDIYSAADAGKVTLMGLLDLSAAFDTVDHCILFERLKHSYGFGDAVLGWFKSYLTDRSQCICYNACYVGNHYNPLRSSSRIGTGASLVSSLFGRCHPYRHQARFLCTFLCRRSADLRSHAADVLRKSGDSHVHLRHRDQLMDGKQPFETQPIKDWAIMVGLVAPVETLPSRRTNHSWCSNQTNTARSKPWRGGRRWANDGKSHQPPHPHVLLSSPFLLLHFSCFSISFMSTVEFSLAFFIRVSILLLERLATSFGMAGTALAWLRLFLTGRSQQVSFNGGLSSIGLITTGVPQGSVLGPLLFLLYSADVPLIANQHGLGIHCYADDGQIYVFDKAAEAVGMINKVASCIEEIDRWMSSNRLKLNSEKTQFIWLGSRQQLSKVGIDHVQLGNYAVTPQSTVCNLGVHLDGQLTMKVHVQRISQTSFYQLRQLRSVRRSLSVKACTALVHAFVTSRLDYCNSLLAGIGDGLIDQLQTVMRVAARLVPQKRKFDPISADIRDRLHWLPIRSRIDFKLGLLVYKCLHGIAPAYLTETLVLKSTVPAFSRLRSTARGDRSSCAENKNKNDWATKLCHFWARTLEQTAWRLEGPFPDFTCFQTKIEIISV